MKIKTKTDLAIQLLELKSSIMQCPELTENEFDHLEFMANLGLLVVKKELAHKAKNKRISKKIEKQE